MVFHLSWRNILLRKQRTIITLLLSTISTFLFVFYMCLMDGSYGRIFKDSVELYPGYIKVTHQKYDDDPSYENLVFNEKETIVKLKANSEVEAVASRFNGFGLYASDENAIGGMFTAVDPVNEPKMSKIPHMIKSGRYLMPDDTTGVFIGSGLASRLKVDMNDTFSVITTATDYSFAAENLKIIGIFETGIVDFDNMSVFINKTYFDTFMESQNIASEIIVLPKDTHNSLQLSIKLSTEIGDDTLLVEDWHTYLSALIEGMEIDRISGMMTLGIFIAVIFFVVMIYSFISMFARIKEIGVMRALGTTPSQIIQILVLETLLLAFISAIIGGLFGGYLAYYFQLNPINLGEIGDAYKEFGLITTELPALFSWTTTFKGMVYVFILNLISIIYPIYKVLSFRPIDAIHHV